jgi:hypothetical protein
MNANSFKNTKKFCFTTKWNGTNILFYKYQDKEGNYFFTAKTKGFNFFFQIFFQKVSILWEIQILEISWN